MIELDHIFGEIPKYLNGFTMTVITNPFIIALLTMVIIMMIFTVTMQPPSIKTSTYTFLTIVGAIFLNFYGARHMCNQSVIKEDAQHTIDIFAEGGLDDFILDEKNEIDD